MIYLFLKRKRGEFQKLVENNEEHWTDPTKKDLLRYKYIQLKFD
jgi:hypothetical protein